MFRVNNLSKSDLIYMGVLFGVCLMYWILVLLINISWTNKFLLFLISLLPNMFALIYYFRRRQLYKRISIGFFVIITIIFMILAIVFTNQKFIKQTTEILDELY